MITIWKENEAGSELVEEFSGVIENLKVRLDELRADGNKYRAEQINDCFALIFDL